MNTRLNNIVNLRDLKNIIVIKVIKFIVVIEKNLKRLEPITLMGNSGVHDEEWVKMKLCSL
jgi:hypothetical protein